MIDAMVRRNNKWYGDENRVPARPLPLRDLGARPEAASSEEASSSKMRWISKRELVSSLDTERTAARSRSWQQQSMLDPVQAKFCKP